MKPTVTELLSGATVALMTPMPPEAGPEYSASRMGMVATLNALAAIEADKAVPVRVKENAAIRAVLAQGGAHGAQFAAAAAKPDPDLSISALDAANADLRRALIALHEAVETAGDRALDRLILGLYRDMAAGRRLDMPGG